MSSNFHTCCVNITIAYDQLMFTTFIKDAMTNTMERTTAHINTILSTINFVCLPWRAQAICCHTNMEFLVIKELFVERCGVMSWQPPQACCRVCVCRNAEGWGAEAGCSGSQERDRWGRGGEHPKQLEKGPTLGLHNISLQHWHCNDPWAGHTTSSKAA